MHFTRSCLGVLLLAGCLHAQTSYPMITHVSPVAVQRGKTTEVAVTGQMNFAGVYKALFEGAGVSAVELPPMPATTPKAAVKSVKLKVKVDEDAAPGVRDFRLASTLGASSVGQIVVVDFPVVQEKGVNNTLDQANPIPVPCAACGVIEIAEDVDYFRFHAEAGQTLTFEVLCARIQDRIHDLQKHADPMLTLFDATGRELAANDDFYFADPLLQYTFTKAGDYFIQVRDSKYDGDPRWVYALLVTSGPSVTHVFPMAGNPGQQLEVEPIGSAKLLAPKVTVTLPKQEGVHSLALDVKGQKTNPTAFIVSALPQVIEQEPNDTPEKAMRITLPCGINGRIGQPRDLDHFIFKATKGKAIRLEVKARRFGTPLQSSLDSVLDVMTRDGKVLASNDDANGKDAALVFTPPADDDYILRLRDLNSKGGETAVYYLEADWALPDFTLRCDPDKAMIGPGTSMAWFVMINRVNGFTGPVKVEVRGLPRGVTVNPVTIPAALTTGVLVLTADSTAPRDMVNVEIVGTATAKGADGKDVALVRTATPRQEIYSPGGGRALFDVSMQTVSVTDAPDILKVEVMPTRIRLKPGQEVKIDVTIQRRPDYDKGVSIDVILRHLGSVFANPLPPGVTMEAKSKTLLGTGNKGTIVLKAAANAAPVEDVPIAVMAHVSVNFVVKVGYSSPAILLTVEK
jgi:hypothetical protein